MNAPFQGTLFDGDTLAGIPVTLALAAGRLRSEGETPAVDVPWAGLRCSDRLGNVPRFLYLPDGRTIETPDNAAVDLLLHTQSRGQVVRFVHALEQHSRIAAVATVLLVASTAAAIWWALPVLALRAAQAVPERIEAQAGLAGLAAINRFLQPSQLDRNERNRVQTQLDRLVFVEDIKQTPRLEFRSMGGNSPNAFALPGGVIIFSDELVKLAGDSDEELAAVLAHEIAHWQLRHGLQGVMRSSAALLVVSTITGDLSTLTTFASTIPFTLLQRGYSREFEAEADRHAVALLRKAKVDPQALASILAKLAALQPAKGRSFGYMSTHPSTDDRVTALGLVPVVLPPPPAKPAPKAKEQEKDKVPPYDVAPKPLVRNAPFYPAKLRDAHVSGTVTVEFTIDTNGNVLRPRVVHSSDQRFEAAALLAVSSWTFEPARKGDRPVAMTASQKLEFNWAD